MLIKKGGYDKDSIVSLKIMNGDEIIGRITSDDENSYTVERPMTVVPSQKGIALVQSMFSTDQNESFTIAKAHVMMHSATVEQVADHYRELTTGIKTVRNGGIIT